MAILEHNLFQEKNPTKTTEKEETKKPPKNPTKEPQKDSVMGFADEQTTITILTMCSESEKKNAGKPKIFRQTASGRGEGRRGELKTEWRRIACRVYEVHLCFVNVSAPRAP